METRIKVPALRKWADEKTEETKAFIEQVAAALELPENWRNYLELSFTNDFFTIKERGGYGVTSFKRAKKGGELVMTDDLKEDIALHIDGKIAADNLTVLNGRKREYYTKIALPIVQSLVTGGFSCTGIGEEIIVNVHSKGNNYNVAKCTISHDGKLSDVIFSDYLPRYSYTIGQLEAIVSLNKPLESELLAKANEVLNALPKEWFEPMPNNF